MYRHALRLAVAVAVVLSGCSSLPPEVEGCMEISRLNCECWDKWCVSEDEAEAGCLEQDYYETDATFLPCYASVLEENCSADQSEAHQAAIEACPL